MKQLLHIATILAASATAPAMAQTYQTGLTELTIEDNQTDRPLEGAIWYPTLETEGAQKHHGNGVWQAINAIADAPPAGGDFPLVVLSHGMYGNIRNQSWLAADLAKRGYIVASINHPGTSSWLRDPDDSRQLWERPRDISRVIDHFTQRSGSDFQIDENRIFMGGHSLGGFTAIALAGGRYSKTQMDAFCAAGMDDLVCGIWDRWEIGKTPEDQAMMEGDLSDPRIKGFAVFDLGGTQSFSKESLSQTNTPMIIYGAPMSVHGLNLDVESRALIARLPKESVQYLEPETLTHFDFMGECTQNGLDILKEEEPDDVYVCIDGTEERRADHQMIADTVHTFFNGL